jgi:hypothetical protein
MYERWIALGRDRDKATIGPSVSSGYQELGNRGPRARMLVPVLQLISPVCKTVHPFGPSVSIVCWSFTSGRAACQCVSDHYYLLSLQPSILSAISRYGVNWSVSVNVR